MLIVTPTNFLAKYGEETFGTPFQFTYNMQRDAYVSFEQLFDVLPSIEVPTFLLFDEIDSFLFDRPLVTPLNSNLKDKKIVFKPKLLLHENVCGVFGVSGTIDRYYGVQAVKQMCGKVFFVSAPNLLNTEAALCYRQGTESNYFISKEETYEGVLA